MKEYERIESLIERYYNGETSLEEEQQLQTFFEGEDIPDHLKSYRDQFILMSELGKVENQISDDSLFSKIEIGTEKEHVLIQMKSYSVPRLYKIAAAVVLLMVGYWAGNKFTSDDNLNNIQKQLDDMKEVMFSQLESNSASGRLQAVNNSMDFEEADDEVVDVLLAVLKNDESMHVRRKAVEALTKFGASRKVSRSFSDALLNETEPAVQLALIEGLVKLKERGTIEVLENLTQDDTILKEVQDEAHLGIFKLREL
jgi:hypothetical protein